MKSVWKRETTADYTAWDLNCKKVLPHNKNKNQLEKIFKRKNRRKVKQRLDNLKRICYNNNCQEGKHKRR